MTNVTTKMTDKQYEFIVNLLKERDYAPSIPLATQLELMEAARETTSRKAASKMIEDLLSSPMQVPIRTSEDQILAEALRELKEGYYEFEGDVYRVKRGKSGRLYASVLLPSGKFEFTKGAMAKLALAHVKPLNVEEAAKLGRIRGRCIACGTELTNPESIARGIGPICAQKF